MKETIQIPQPGAGNRIHDQIFDCIQCGYCSSFCAVSFFSKDSPRKIIRHLQCDELADAAASPFLRLCKQCLTCTQLCPQGVDVAEIMRRLVRYHFIGQSLYE